MNGKINLSVVVPCYNEGTVMNELYRRVKKVCDKLNLNHYEIILVNDGSRDNTWKMIKDLSDQDPNIVGICLSRNFGHQYSLSAGLEFSRGERILILDADLQDPPELLPEMMKLMDEGADVVYGKRIQRKGESFLKRFTASFFYRIFFHITDVDIPRDTGDFRLMSKRVKDILLKMPEHHRFIRGMVSWIGFKQIPLDYIREKRYAGKTKYTWKKMITFALDAVTSFSISPLRVATYISFIFACFAIASIGYVVFSWILLDTFPGWASTVFIISVLGAIQLFVFGIIGEYVGRIYMESKKRPKYVVSEIVSQQK
jgi:dolichol-phosphate mannosyltransferase